MNILTAINNLKCLATHSSNDLTVGSDGATLKVTQEGMDPATEKELQRIISDTTRVYQQIGRPLWIHLKNGEQGQRIGIEAGKLLQLLQGKVLQKPLPPDALESHSNVTFIVNGEKIPADRQLVAEASPVFEKMLFGGFKEANQDEIQIEKEEAEFFRTFLSFTNTDKLPEINDPNHIIELYALAEKYDAQLFGDALTKRLAELIEPSDLQELITGNPRLFAQTASAMGATKTTEIADEIYKTIQSIENNTEIEDKKTLILTAKKAMVAWINQSHIPLKDAAGEKQPREFFHWLDTALHDLEYAYFTNFHFVDNELDFLEYCPNLQYLDISWCKKLNENALEALQYCPNLQHLNITGCTQLDEKALEKLQYCPNLQHLNIAGCTQLDEKALEKLQYCPNLQHLNIFGCTQLNENALEKLQHCPNLKHLDISFCNQRNENALNVLQYCPNLQHLNITGCTKLDEKALEKLQHCPNLQHLNISECVQLNENALEKLQHCPNLKHLDISYCNQLNENALNMLQYCPNLLSLNITGCTQLIPNALEKLQHCPNLQHLDISGCTQLNPNALDVLQNCPNLQHLDISYCNQLNENALNVLQYCPNLQRLTLKGCTQLNPNPLAVLMHCPHLQHLDVSRCTQLNAEALNVLQHCKYLQLLIVLGCNRLRTPARKFAKHRMQLKVIV